MILIYDNRMMKQINTDLTKWINLISMSRMEEAYLKAF